MDAAIIFADLLLPFTPMGLDFVFVAGEGPQVHTPVRSLEHVQALRTDRADELGYVAKSIEKNGGEALWPGPGRMEIRWGSSGSAELLLRWLAT